MSDLNNTQNNMTVPDIKQDLTDMSNIVNNNICDKRQDRARGDIYDRMLF